jgi:hypothetical protein
MSLGYVEELALRYFEKKGYLCHTNIRFQMKKQQTGKKIAGWSDIDLISLRPKEFAIVQCKSFLGTEKSTIIEKKIKLWFENAIVFIKEDEIWKYWLKGRKIRKILIVDFSVKKTEAALKRDGIVILRYSDLLFELLNLLKSGAKRKGKEDDVIIRLLCAMLDMDIIKV